MKRTLVVAIALVVVGPGCGSRSLTSQYQKREPTSFFMTFALRDAIKQGPLADGVAQENSSRDGGVPNGDVPVVYHRSDRLLIKLDADGKAKLNAEGVMRGIKSDMEDKLRASVDNVTALDLIEQYPHPDSGGHPDASFQVNYSDGNLLGFIEATGLEAMDGFVVNVVYVETVTPFLISKH